VRNTGIFSSLRYDEQTGDLLGMEVFLFPDHALVQCAGGGLPASALVADKVDGTRVSFTLPEGLPECGTRFEGTLSAGGLRGRFTEQREAVWLPRKKSYWQ
jgi:hypothetical protein